MKRLKKAVKDALRAAGVRVGGRIKGFRVETLDGKGRGLFALRPYAARETLLPVSGPLTVKRGFYTFQVGEFAHLDPDEPLGIANHSCDPNAGFLVAGDGRVALSARRPIAAGEEVTWDYAMAEADFLEDGVPESFECRCGAARCRGVIEKGWSGLSDALKAEYRPWCMPYLRERA
ncbi:MAG: SET domain-containing methyltransferase [Elusimicrobiota bacterium]|nr:SET domain-containing methyltransferase [Elusimicrobiota bacterium]